jgi:transposase
MGSTITAVMEPTGMSWFPVARWLEQAGIKAIRVKGQRVRALRRYLSEHTKTDAADAYVLGCVFRRMPAGPSDAKQPVIPKEASP